MYATKCQAIEFSIEGDILNDKHESFSMTKSFEPKE
jgi:hypothetical protein